MLTVAMHGVTGRMGANQHYRRSILEIIKQGGVRLANGDRVQVEPILVGRDANRLKHLAQAVAREAIGRGVAYTTDLEAVLRDPAVDIVFDAANTQTRAGILKRAIAHGKAIYCEKPVADRVDTATELAALCQEAGVKNGVVQDKLWLPGIRKLRMLRDQGYFGKVLNIRGEFGYWVFTGEDACQPAQRPAWNYRREDGGGMMLDMFCHYEYLLRDLFGSVQKVLAHAVTDIVERVDESGQPYRCTADDAAYALFVLDNGIRCQFNSSWTTRVRRDDLFTLQVDGTAGSAVAGLRECWIQPAAATPRPVWDPDAPQPIDFFQGWQQLPDATTYENAFKLQWERFLQHVAGEVDFPWSIHSGVHGLALAEAGQRSTEQASWVDLPTAAS